MSECAIYSSAITAYVFPCLHNNENLMFTVICMPRFRRMYTSFHLAEVEIVQFVCCVNHSC